MVHIPDGGAGVGDGRGHVHRQQQQQRWQQQHQNRCWTHTLPPSHFSPHTQKHTHTTLHSHTHKHPTNGAIVWGRRGVVGELVAVVSYGRTRQKSSIIFFFSPDTRRRRFSTTLSFCVHQTLKICTLSTRPQTTHSFCRLPGVSDYSLLMHLVPVQSIS